MGQEKQLRLIFFAFLALPFLLSACKLEEALLPTDPTGDDAISSDAIITATTPGTTTSSGITAPIISNPLSGSTVSDAQPALTVLNSAQAGNSTLTYLFQVSTDSSFQTLEAQSNQVPEGANGSTTWQVDPALAGGRHFWRVRSRSGTVDSAFSSTAEFTIGSGGGGGGAPPPPAPNPPPSAGTVVSDPLNGGSIGEVNGGQFTNSGWRVNSPANFIRYEVPPMSSGWVEFDVSGLREANPSPDQFMLFGMWDPTAGDYRTNPYRVHLQKLHPNPHNPPYFRLRWIANGQQHDEGSNFLNWSPSRTYRIRLEWGPSGSGHTARVYLDGQQMITANYTRTYRPNVLFVELGIGERGESIVGATYSNVQIGN